MGYKRAALLLWRLIKAFEALPEHGSVPWLLDQSLCHHCSVLPFASHLTWLHLSQSCEESRLFPGIWLGVKFLGAVCASEERELDAVISVLVLHAASIRRLCTENMPVFSKLPPTPSHPTPCPQNTSSSVFLKAQTSSRCSEQASSWWAVLLQCFSLERVYVFSLNHRSAVVGGIKKWEQAISWPQSLHFPVLWGLSNCAVGKQRWIHPIQPWNLHFTSIQFVPVIVHCFGFSDQWLGVSLLICPLFSCFSVQRCCLSACSWAQQLEITWGQSTKKINCPGSGKFFLCRGLLLRRVLP